MDSVGCVEGDEERGGVVADFTGWEEFLEFGPGLEEVPVGVVFGEVVGSGGAGPVHEVEIDVVLGGIPTIGR